MSALLVVLKHAQTPTQFQGGGNTHLSLNGRDVYTYVDILSAATIGIVVMESQENGTADVL